MFFAVSVLRVVEGLSLALLDLSLLVPATGPCRVHVYSLSDQFDSHVNPLSFDLARSLQHALPFILTVASKLVPQSRLSHSLLLALVRVCPRLEHRWSPDGKQILTTSADKTAKLWNMPEGTVAK